MTVLASLPLGQKQLVRREREKKRFLSQGFLSGDLSNEYIGVTLFPPATIKATVSEERGEGRVLSGGQIPRHQKRAATVTCPRACPPFIDLSEMLIKPHGLATT